MSNSVELRTISLCHNKVHAAIRNNLDEIALFMRNESIINKTAYNEVTDKARLSEDDRATMTLRKWENKVEEDTDCYHKVVREYFGKQPDYFNAVLRKLNDEYTKLCETRGETAVDHAGALKVFSSTASFADSSRASEKGSLRENDLNKVFMEIYDAREKWMNIGLYLDLKFSTLKVIGKDHLGNANDCCQEMLHKWLTGSNEKTWKKLADALDCPTVNYTDLAKKIRKKYPTQ